MLSLTNTVNALRVAVDGDLNAITTAVIRSGGDISAQVQLVATVNADLSDIVAQFSTAVTAIIASTANLTHTLLDSEIVTLIAAIGVTGGLIISIETNLLLVLASLSAATRTLIQAEVTAAAGAVQPFVTPLIAYSSAVQSTSLTGSANIEQNLSVAINALATLSGLLDASFGV